MVKNNREREHICISYKKKTLISFITKTILSLIFLTFCSGFTYSNNVQEVPEYIRENIEKGNINLEDKITVDLKTKISQEEYENTIKDVENFLKENHVIFNNTSREEFSKECEKFIKNKKEHTIIDTLLDLRVLISSLKQGHLGFGSGYFTELLPIDLMMFPDGYYISKCENKNSDMLGSKLLSINNTSIGDVETKVSKYFQSENKNLSRTNIISNIRIVDNLKREGIVNNQVIKLKLEKNGKIFYKNIIPTKYENWEFGKIISKYTDFYFFNMSEILKITKNPNFVSVRPLDIINLTERNFYSEIKNKDLIIYYNACLENTEYSIYNFTKEINEKLYKNKPSKIIVDLRFNGGGSTLIYHNIIREILLYQRRCPNIKIKILISNKSYSAAGFAIIETMRKLNNVEIIGTGSGFTIKNTTGSDSLLYIKNLKAYCQYGKILVSQNYEKEDVFKHNYKNYDYKNDMLTPDFYAEQSFSDYMIGNDPAMNYALRDEGDSSLINKIKKFLNNRNKNR